MDNHGLKGFETYELQTDVKIKPGVRSHKSQSPGKSGRVYYNEGYTKEDGC